jgi:hypothetical protein
VLFHGSKRNHGMCERTACAHLSGDPDRLHDFRLRELAPEVDRAFKELSKAVFKVGALDTRTKQLLLVERVATPASSGSRRGT